MGYYRTGLVKSNINNFSALVCGLKTSIFIKVQPKKTQRILSFVVAVLFAFTSCLVISPSELFAAPSAAAPVISPASVPAGSTTQLTVTSRMIQKPGDPPLAVTSATLNQVDVAGKVTKSWAMRDDGTLGDATALDNNFSVRINTTPGPQVSHLYYQVSVAFRGVVRRYITPTTTVPVISSNQPPVITSSPQLETPNDIEYFYPITATDPEGQAVTLVLVTAPEGMTLVNNQLVWTPAKTQIGIHSITINANDPQNAVGTQTFNLEVFEQNLSPFITSIPGTFAKTSERYAYDCNAFDPEGEQVTFTFTSAPPAGVTLNSVSGLMEWIPGTGQIGSHVVKIEAADNFGATDEQTYTLEVYNKNTTLQLISPAGEYEAPVGEVLTLPFQSNMAKTVFSGVPVPENSEFNPQSFIFNPTAEQVGSHVVVFRAKAAGQEVSNVVTINVTKDEQANQPPQFVAIPSQSIAEGSPLVFLVNASDGDGDTLKFSAPGLSLANAFFNEVTREFHFTPSFLQAGEYDVTFSVTDGTSPVQTTAHITVQNVEPSVTVLDLVVDKTPNPTLRTTLPISGSIKGEVGAPPAPEVFRMITGLNPAQAQAGDQLEVILTAINTDFTEGTATVSFGDGITVESLEILTPLSAKAHITINKEAALGVRAVEMTQDGQTVPSIVAFVVLEAVATIKGKVFDEFTQQPIEGAKVGVNGSLAFGLTNAQGEFLINEVPSGNLTLIATKQNYTVGQASLSLGAGEDLVLTQPIALRALARPPALGGILPPEPTVASVIDRGVSSKGGGLTLDQAKAVVTDTIIAVGGIEAGVLDEAGNQLNPKITGEGDLSVNPVGVEFLAKAMMRGEVVTLREFFEVLQGAFNFVQEPTIDEVVAGFQKQVDEAWDNPIDPEASMPIILFNEGTTLSSQPPVISPDTRFNRFQIFLLIHSFMLFNAVTLNESANRILAANGVDIEPLIPPPAFPPLAGSKNPPDGFAFAGSFLIPDAEAGQVQTSRCADESFSCYVADLQKKKTFSKVWRAIGANMIAEASKAAIVAAGITFAMQSAISFAMGASGGRYGAVIGAVNLLTAAISGFQSVLMFKIVMGWFIAVTVASLEPPPVAGRESRVDDKGNFIVPFDLSPEHVRTEGNPPVGQIKRHFAYHLYRLPNCDAPVDAAKAEFVPLNADPDFTHNSNRNAPFLGPHKFTVPRSMLKQGENHFRVRAFQYIQHHDKQIIEGITPLDLDQSGGMNLNEYQKAGLGSNIDFAVTDLNNDDIVDDNEYAKLLESKIPAEHQITDDAPTTAEIKAMLGKMDLLPGEQPGSYKAELAARQQELQARADGRVDTTSKGYKARTNIVDFHADSPFVRGNAEFLPEIEDFANNTKAFIAADDIILETNLVGKQAQLDGDDVVAKQVADKVYQKHFGANATEEQTASVKELVRAQRLKSIAATQALFTGQAQQNLEAVIDDLKSGRLTSGKIVLPMPSYPSADSTEMHITTIRATVTPTNVDDVLHFLGESVEANRNVTTPIGKSFIETTQSSIRQRAANHLSQDAQNPVLKDTLKHHGGFTDEEIDAKFSNYFSKQKGVGIRGQAIARMTAKNEVELRELIAQMKKRQVGPLTIQEPEIDPRSGAIVKGIGAFSNFTGQVLGASSTFLTFLQSAQVLSSDFSEACFSTPGPATPVPTEQFPPTFEPYPGDDEPSAIIRELRAGKDGFLQREYPGEDAHVSAFSAGYPPGFVSSDRKGNVYAINMASTEKFGGRIFKFKLKRSEAGEDGFQGIAGDREFVGAVNYFSMEIQVSRPAFPVAMAVGPTYAAAGETGQVQTQDLFVANLDLVDGVNRILQVPISLLDTRPNSYPVGGIPVYGKDANGNDVLKFHTSVRHRIVGQPVVESEDFRFTGPSDIEVGPDPSSLIPVENEKSAILISDEGIIFAMKKTLAGGYELVKVISNLPGRRWSGMAFDRMGKFYFADYANGEIFVMDWDKLQSAISNGVIIVNEQMLSERAFRIASGIDRPGDLELEGLSKHPGGVLHVSTFSGIIPLTLPIIGPVGEAQNIRVSLFGVEQPVQIDPERGVFIATPSRDNLEAMQANIRFRQRDVNGRDTWKERIVLIAENGATLLKEPLA